MLEAKNHLILAMDIGEISRAINIAESAVDHIDAIKVHWPVILNHGLNGVERLSRLRPVIVDAKLSDIPYTNGVASEMMFSSGASAVICQGFAGDDSVKACIEAEGDVFVLVEMSHPGSQRFITPQSEKLAEMAREVGATGIVAPGNNPKRIELYRDIVGPDMQILCPGIGAQGGKPGDAVANGADFEIVGRSIYKSEDPPRSAARIAESISQKLGKRLI